MLIFGFFARFAPLHKKVVSVLAWAERAHAKTLFICYAEGQTHIALTLSDPFFPSSFAPHLRGRQPAEERGEGEGMKGWGRGRVRGRGNAYSQYLWRVRGAAGPLQTTGGERSIQATGGR